MIKLTPLSLALSALASSSYLKVASARCYNEDISFDGLCVGTHESDPASIYLPVAITCELTCSGTFPGDITVEATKRGVIGDSVSATMEKCSSASFTVDLGTYDLKATTDCSALSGNGGISIADIEVSCCAGDENGRLWCFSSDSMVDVLEKGATAMKDLQVGDKVLTGNNNYESVYGFSHRKEDIKADFLEFHTDTNANRKPLQVTGSHLLYVDGQPSPVTAESLESTDALVKEDGSVSKIQKIKKVTRKDGIYAPLTPSGTVVVDGIKASNYISLQEHANQNIVLSNGMTVPISQHSAIHLFLAPFRVLCVQMNLCPATWLENTGGDNGMIQIAETGIQLVQFAEHRSVLVQLAMLALFLVVVVPFYVMEQVVSSWDTMMMMPVVTLLVGLFVSARMYGKNNNKVKTV